MSGSNEDVNGVEGRYTFSEEDARKLIDMEPTEVKRPAYLAGHLSENDKKKHQERVKALLEFWRNKNK